MYTRLLFTLSLIFGLPFISSTNRLFAQANGNIVISQIYSGGGLTGSTWLNDYVELYNRSTVTVDISTWAIQYAGPKNTSWRSIPLKGSIQSGQYYLILFGSTDGVTGQPLPPYDARNGATNLGNTDGKLAITRTTTALTIDPIGGVGPEIEDYVGYGLASTFEGTGATVQPSVTNSVYRLENGLLDTGNNVNDFMLMAANPRNTSSPFQPVPEPFTMGIIALAVVGGAALRQRFQKKNQLSQA